MKKITGSIVALVTPFNQDGSTDFVRLRELTEKKETCETLLDQKMDRWMYLTELAEQIEAQKNS